MLKKIIRWLVEKRIKRCYSREKDGKGGVNVINVVEKITNAVQLLQKYDIADTLPVDVEGICEKEGFTVNFVDLSRLEKEYKKAIYGVLYVHPDGKDIFVSERDIPERQRFTIAHELAHYYLHLGDNPPEQGSIISFRGERSRREHEADQFAAELLMPEDAVWGFVEEGRTPFISDFAQGFDVSKAAMRYRLDKLNLRYIDL